MRFFLRDNPYQLLNKNNFVGQNPHKSCGVHLNQVPLTGQQHYPSHSLRRNEDKGSGDPTGNDGH